MTLLSIARDFTLRAFEPFLSAPLGDFVGKAVRLLGKQAISLYNNVMLSLSYERKTADLQRAIHRRD